MPTLPTLCITRNLDCVTKLSHRIHLEYVPEDKTTRDVSTSYLVIRKIATEVDPVDSHQIGVHMNRVNQLNQNKF